MSFSSYLTAATMRDRIEEISKGVVDRERPKYRYGVVDTIDSATQRVFVTFAGSPTPVPIRYGSREPAVGEFVRIAGHASDRYVDDVTSGTHLRLNGADGWWEIVNDADYTHLTTDRDAFYVNNEVFSSDASTPTDDLALVNKGYVHSRPGVYRRHRTAASGQSIPNSTATAVGVAGSGASLPFFTTGTDITYDTGTSTFTINVECYAHIDAGVEWESNGDSSVYVARLVLNGTTTLARDATDKSTSTVIIGQALSTLWKFDVDDELELVVFQNSGSAQNIASGEQTFVGFKIWPL